jgi:large repetitive protein
VKYFTLLILLSFNCLAQKQGNVWYFGYQAGLDFNSGAPTPLLNGQTYTADGTAIEGTAIISDSTGSLLFYTNGMKIWNKNHQVMPNGDSILSGFSGTQCALILPQPGSSQYFYVFTTDDYHLNNLKYGFRYSLVDVCLQNGDGDVVAGEKNIKLLDTVCEKLTAVRHANGIDYWILVHKYFSNAFFAYRLSSGGIVDTVISAVGNRHPRKSLPNLTGYSIGQLKASPDGQKLCIVSANGYGIAEYFDFDKATGQITNPVDITIDSTYHYYGASFSSDSKILYITSCLNGNGIFQFDLTRGGGHPDSVRVSRQKITGIYNYFALQLGPDGKIYVARAPTNSRLYLGAINYPNVVGSNCDYKDSAIYLGGKISSMGLPNFVDSYSYSNTVESCSTAIEVYSHTDEAWTVPAPSTDVFTIHALNPIISVALYDITGRLLFEDQAPAPQPQINMSRMASGSYLCRIKFAKSEKVLKLIKVNP